MMTFLAQADRPAALYVWSAAAPLATWLRCLPQPGARRLLRHREPELGDERWGGRGVAHVLVAKGGERVALLAPGEAHVHRHQDREHHQRRDGGPLQEEADHDGDEADVLRVAHAGVRPGRGQLARALRLVEHLPRGAEQDEAAEDQDVTRQVQHVPVWVAADAEDRLPELA